MTDSSDKTLPDNRPVIDEAFVPTMNVPPMSDPAANSSCDQAAPGVARACAVTRLAFAAETLESDGVLRGERDVTSGDGDVAPMRLGTVTALASTVSAVC
jgi:hypothetical protein